jgi:hypothetical protein
MATVADIQAALQIAQATLAKDRALLAANPTNTALRQQVQQDLNFIASLDAQLASARVTPVASSGIIARDDQLATVPDSLPQAPYNTVEILDADGRIVSAPDTTSGTTAIPPVNTDSTDSGTDAPVKTIQQTQATPAHGPGLLLDPGDADAQEGGYYGGGGPATPPANTQIGAGFPGDDAGTRPTPNATRQEIDSIFNDAPITPQPNVLDQYASYTYAVSVYLTTEDAYKTMVTSGRKNLTGSTLLFQSGGAPVGGRAPYFSNDYYIEKVELTSKIIGKSTGMTHNVVDFKMTVVEPTGITLIDNLSKAVQAFLPNANVKKNLSSVVYFMVIRFYGYDQQGNLIRGAPGISNPAGSTDTNSFVEKFFPFLIKDIKFKVASKIVEYDITAVGVHYQINSGSARGSVPYNIELSGQTINDLLSGPAQYTGTPQTTTGLVIVNDDDGNPLPPVAPPKADAAPKVRATIRQGLMEAINAFQRELSGPGPDQPYTYPDVYSVEFATPALKSSKVRKAGALDKATTSNASGGTAADQKLGSKQSMDPNSRTQSATAGIQIVQLLDQIMRNSTYLEDQQLVKYDEATGQLLSNGTPAQNVAWFKISLQATPIRYDPKRNDYAYNIKYIISPYRIAQLNSKYFPTPKFTGVQKEYNYWFTGQNTSVLGYEENINNLYYLTLSGVNFSNSGTVLGNNDEQLKYNFNTRSTESSQGAEGKTNEPVANAAEQLLNPGDFRDSTVTIVGDPAWIQQGEAFVGTPIGSSNYFSAFLADGTINFDAGQVLYRIAFNASSDYDLNTGLQTISGLATGSPTTNQPGGPAAINRTFVAKECISSFVKGKFTQQLKGTLLLNATTADNQAAAASAAALQKQAISALSPNRQGSVTTAIIGALSTPSWATSLTGVPQVLATAGVNLFAQNVLGTQSTRPFAVPGAPTSSGLSIATINNAFTSPSRLTNLVNFNSAAEAVEDQLNQTGVVDTVSNGTTQVMAGTDDSGDSSITQEYLNAANNNATQQLDLPESTPTDLGDFFG